MNAIESILGSRQGIERLEALGRVFADAFARYTVQVFNAGTDADTKGGTGDPKQPEYQTLGRTVVEAMLRAGESLPPGDEMTACSPEEAPPWVREAYARARKERGEPLTHDQAVRKVARNQLLVAMRKKGMTQADLARRLGKTPATISRILRKPERSRVATIRAIAEALNVDLSEIL